MSLSTPTFAKKKREMAQLLPNKAFLQPAQTATMCTGSHDYACPPPPIPPFLLAQNLSSKWIGPTDNMQPKLHDDYTRHLWLKGQANSMKRPQRIAHDSAEHASGLKSV